MDYSNKIIMLLGDKIIGCIAQPPPNMEINLNLRLSIGVSQDCNATQLYELSHSFATEGISNYSHRENTNAIRLLFVSLMRRWTARLTFSCTHFEPHKPYIEITNIYEICQNANILSPLQNNDT